VAHEPGEQAVPLMLSTSPSQLLSMPSQTSAVGVPGTALQTVPEPEGAQT